MKQLRQQTYRVLRMLLQYFRQAEIVESPEEIDKVWEQIKIQTARQQKSDNDVSFMYQLMQQPLLQYLLQSEHWFLANSNWDTTLIGSKSTL